MGHPTVQVKVRVPGAVTSIGATGANPSRGSAS